MSNFYLYKIVCLALIVLCASCRIPDAKSDGLKLNEGVNFLIYKSSLSAFIFMVDRLERHHDSIFHQSVEFGLDSSDSIENYDSLSFESLFDEKYLEEQRFRSLYLVRDSKVIDIYDKNILADFDTLRKNIDYNYFSTIQKQNKAKKLYYYKFDIDRMSDEQYSYLFLKDFWVIAYNYNYTLKYILIQVNDEPVNFSEDVEEFFSFNIEEN